GLARELSRLGSVPITPNDLDPSALPDHLRMTFAAVDTDGTVLARGGAGPPGRRCGGGVAPRSGGVPPPPPPPPGADLR
uniref:DUF3418 domain-containing protein n=1 Tax=Nocardia cyriacigeorgica TaxID=135487 RepID=UPI0024574B56